MKPTFLTKQQREELALKRLQDKRKEDEERVNAQRVAHQRFVTGQTLEEKRQEEKLKQQQEEEERRRREKEDNKDNREHDHEVKAIRDHYLGHVEKRKKIVKPSEKFTRIFQFDWDATDDTARNDLNPLYNQRMDINALYGRGYIAGVDQREQRKKSNFLLELSKKRQQEAMGSDPSLERTIESEVAAQLQRSANELVDHPSKKRGHDALGKHWTEKSLQEMTERDWRIFREDFDIRIQGGRATLPIRHWNESALPDAVMKAIEAAKYDKPSPIQRQAIPIGLAGRDIIGIAETGSGKTCAFLVPLLAYLLSVPQTQIDRCNDEGPLAVVMAPTRELAQQIEEECIKLARFTGFRTACVVGGQSIEEQGHKLRRGVEIVIGTPGRMVDCLENNYMVLNQCNYVVLDEADRMIDMGFEGQVVAVLESMGGLLKSEDEQQAELQLSTAYSSTQRYRTTAMFSATMSPEVEQIARTFLRHPAIVRIGDEDSGKNRRIEQRVLFVTEAQKRGLLTEELRKLSQSDKVIVFVNVKKQGDSIGWHLEQQGFHCGILHGGRSQDQREDTLDMFRSGRIQILVATDVAGRGLDIPDVSLVVNFDCPPKIQNYCHRIGRTGRAGKFGVAVSYLTEADTELMYDLKSYLEVTESVVPAQLAKNPAAQQPVGTRDDKGNVMGKKKDSTMFTR